MNSKHKLVSKIRDEKCHTKQTKYAKGKILAWVRKIKAERMQLLLYKPYIAFGGKNGAWLSLNIFNVGKKGREKEMMEGTEIDKWKTHLPCNTIRNSFSVSTLPNHIYFLLVLTLFLIKKNLCWYSLAWQSSHFQIKEKASETVGQQMEPGTSPY